jgi:hypothetical protein
VHNLVKHYKTNHLNELFETTLKSGFPLAKEQAELVHCITKELAERGEIEGHVFYEKDTFSISCGAVSRRYISYSGKCPRQ